MECLVERLNDNAATTKFLPSSLRTPGGPLSRIVAVAPRSVSDNGEHNNKRRLCHLSPFAALLHSTDSGCMFV